MVKTLPAVLLGFLLLLTSHHGEAQNTAADKNVDTSFKFPKAILVQLRSEHNRIEALTKARRYNEAELVGADAAYIRAKMIADFSDHLFFCPVYYYIDTNVDLIKKRKFEGILFKADSTPAASDVIGNDNDYVIVYYGYPNYQSRTTDSLTDNPKNYNYTAGETLNRGTNNYLIEEYGYPAYHTKVVDSTPNKDDDGYGAREPFGKGLVINNNRLQQVSFLYKFGYENAIFRMKKRNRKYIYVSKHFDMEYFPFAEELNSKLITVDLRQRKIRITHYPGLDIMSELFR